MDIYDSINTIDDLERLPEVQAGKNVWQNPSYHPDDVHGHTLQVVRILKEMGASPELIAAGWLHDIGKPPTKKVKKDDNGQVLRNPADGTPYHSFPQHEKKGGEMVKEMPNAMFQRLGLNQVRVAQLVGFHFIPMARVKLAKGNSTFAFFCEQVRELAAELDKTGMKEEILTLFKADKESQQPEDLPFLLALRDHLLRGGGDLHSLFAKFKSAYAFT